MDADPIYQHAIELGLRNAEAIELVRKFCANPRVEHHPMGGIGMVEQMTGLPIGMKTVRCEHAPKPPDFAGAEFLPVALSFYKNNCVGCPQRIPVDIPNLKTVADELEAREQEEARQRSVAEEQSRHERGARHREREQTVMSEPAPSRDLIRLVNDLDEAEPDAEAGPALVAAVRGGPRFVTPAVAEVLLDVAGTALSEHVLEAVRVAAESDVIPPEKAVYAALEALSSSPMTEAVRILLRFREKVTPELLVRVREVLVGMAGRWFGPSFGFRQEGGEAQRRRDDWRDGFALLVELDLAGALSEIEQQLASEHAHERERAAAAVEVLVGWMPEIAPVVAQQLVTALTLDSGGDYFGFDQQTSEAIEAALSACLWANAAATSAAMESGAGNLNDNQRYKLFQAYDSVVRHQGRSPEPAPTEVGSIVVEAALKHTSGDWGDEVLRAAYDLIELTSKWQGHLLDDRVEALFALLLTAISERPPDAPPLELADVTIWALENMSAKTMRRRRIRDLREAIGGIALRKPREVLDLIDTFIAQEDVPGDDSREMRAECTWLLGFVGKRSDYLNDVLPRLYDGLLDVEQLVRTYAVEALIEIAQAHPKDVIPQELSELIPALLTDDYQIVQDVVVRALTRGVPVRAAQREQMMVLLASLADLYANKDDESDRLDNALRALQILTRQTEDPQQIFMVHRLAARLARKLDDYDLRHFLEYGSYQLLDLPEYVAALVDALQRPEIVQEPNSGDSRLREILYRVPPALLQPHAAELTAAAGANLPFSVHGALEYVEILQRLGLWHEAVQLADEIRDSIPLTVDHASERTYAEQVLAWARTEAAIATDPSEMQALIERAIEATAVHRQAAANAETSFPWAD